MTFFTQDDHAAHLNARHGSPQDHAEYGDVVDALVREMIEQLQIQARYEFTTGRKNIRIVVASDKSSRDEDVAYAPKGMVEDALRAALPEAFDVPPDDIQLVRAYFDNHGSHIPGTYDQGHRGLTVRVEFKNPLK